MIEDRYSLLEKQIAETDARYVVAGPAWYDFLEAQGERLGVEIIYRPDCPPDLIYLLRDLPVTWPIGTTDLTPAPPH